MRTRELLLRAAERINRYGWCQRVERDGRGRLCMLGALRVKGSTREERWRAKRKLMGALCGDDLAWWNDDPERTREQVIAVLRKAAR